MRKSIELAIKIINHAIITNNSVKSSCACFGVSPTYVKNVRIDASKSKNMEYDEFNRLYSEYMDKSDKKFTKIISENTPVVKNNETINVKTDNNEKLITFNNVNRVLTLEQLLKKCNVDTNVWDVKDYTVNKWDTTSFKNNTPIISENYQVKAKLEKNSSFIKSKAVIDVYEEMCKTYTPQKQMFNTFLENPQENNLLEISIFDLHIGKLGWKGETGEDYDSKIAIKRFIYSIDTLIKRASGFPVNRILFPVGSDFFNSDNSNNTTHKGTPQEEDSRWQKTFSVGVRLLVDGINRLKELGVPVDVVVIPGNHDYERTYYMGEFLYAWFRNDAQVTINNEASPRKYYRFGDVLLGFTHGDQEKIDSLGLLMATDIDSKPLWSVTKFHEWHLGHIHRKKTKKQVVYDNEDILTEDKGIIIRHMSSLTGNEDWHHKKGFVGQIKAADAFIWNDKLGFVAHLNSNYII